MFEFILDLNLSYSNMVHSFLVGTPTFVETKQLTFLAKKCRTVTVLLQDTGVMLGSESKSKEASVGVNFDSKFLTCLNQVMKAKYSTYKIHRHNYN